MKKLLPVILGLALAGGGFFAYTTFLAGGPPPEPPAIAQKKAKTELVTKKKARLKDKIDGKIASLGDSFTVNLADEAASAYVKVDVSLRVDADTAFEAAAAEGAAGPPKLEEGTEIRNIVIDVLNSHASTELLKLEGREHAKEEIIKAINDLKGTTPKTVALEVFFSNFAVQVASAA